MSLRSKIIAQTGGDGLLWLMISAVALVAIFYVYSVNRTIVYVAKRDSIESKVSAIRTAITGLDSAYISGRSGITMEVATSLGYGEASKVVYMPKKAVSVLTRSETIQ